MKQPNREAVCFWKKVDLKTPAVLKTKARNKKTEVKITTAFS